ncbi:MAG: acetate kinase [Gammaproteobacteria bacterium]|nr:acetate kinase [Gammaproteobacteria bacterium]
MKILVLNSGSSSLKFQLFDMRKQQKLTSGLLENVADHQQAISRMEEMLKESGCMNSMSELTGIGHRVVHGGEDFHNPVLIDETVMASIEKLIPLAPLHNPANLAGIKVARQKAPQLPQVAVFDTSFHQSIPEHAYIYGLPYTLYEKQQVRRYGFHGTSHHYVAQQAADYLTQKYGKDKTQLKLISLHLGNGASAAAIQNGKSIDTSMGMTPLEGMVMGTRCGDIDPAIPFYLAREMGMTIQELDDLLNKQSGLKGICDENDMRTIIGQADKGDTRAELAINIFCYHIKKYLGAYLASLNGVDGIIFTGGIGENSSIIRERSCENLDNLGIKIDLKKNNHRAGNIMEIQDHSAQVIVLVIPTNEELEIALQTSRLIQQQE